MLGAIFYKSGVRIHRGPLRERFWLWDGAIIALAAFLLASGCRPADLRLHPTSRPAPPGAPDPAAFVP